eukprot:2108665-Amphidinium_carterae.1
MDWTGLECQRVVVPAVVAAQCCNPHVLFLLGGGGCQGSQGRGVFGWVGFLQAQPDAPRNPTCNVQNF